MKNRILEYGRSRGIKRFSQVVQELIGLGLETRYSLVRRGQILAGEDPVSYEVRRFDGGSLMVLRGPQSERLERLLGTCGCWADHPEARQRDRARPVKKSLRAASPAAKKRPLQWVT
jgi:hypothetical protein